MKRTQVKMKESDDSVFFDCYTSTTEQRLADRSPNKMRRIVVAFEDRSHERHKSLRKKTFQQSCQKQQKTIASLDDRRLKRNQIMNAALEEKSPTSNKRIVALPEEKCPSERIAASLEERSQKKNSDYFAYATVETCSPCGSAQQLLLNLKKKQMSPSLTGNDTMALKCKQAENDTQNNGKHLPSPTFKVTQSFFNPETNKTAAIIEGHFPLAKNRQVIVQYNTDLMCPQTATGTTGRTVCIAPPEMTRAPYAQPTALPPPCESPPVYIPPPASSCTISPDDENMSHCPAYDYLTFNQFHEFKQLWRMLKKGGCKGAFRFLLLLLLTIVFFYIAFLLLLYFIEKLQIGFLGADSDGSQGDEKLTSKNFWDLIKPKEGDLWRQTDW